MLKIVTAIFSMVGKKEGVADQDPKEKVEKIFSLMDKVNFLVQGYVHCHYYDESENIRLLHPIIYVDNTLNSGW